MEDIYKFLESKVQEPMGIIKGRIRKGAKLFFLNEYAYAIPLRGDRHEHRDSQDPYYSEDGIFEDGAGSSVQNRFLERYLKYFKKNGFQDLFLSLEDKFADPGELLKLKNWLNRSLHVVERKKTLEERLSAFNSSCSSYKNPPGMLGRYTETSNEQRHRLFDGYLHVLRAAFELDFQIRGGMFYNLEPLSMEPTAVERQLKHLHKELVKHFWDPGNPRLTIAYVTSGLFALSLYSGIGHLFKEFYGDDKVVFILQNDGMHEDLFKGFNIYERLFDELINPSNPSALPAGLRKPTLAFDINDPDMRRMLDSVPAFNSIGMELATYYESPAGIPEKKPVEMMLRSKNGGELPFDTSHLDGYNNFRLYDRFDVLLFDVLLVHTKS